MRTKEELPACPVATTVSLIGSKWKLLILRNLRIRSWRFNELKQDLDGISQKVLTDSLRSLEKDGIPHGLSRDPAPCRICPKSHWEVHGADYSSHGNMG